MAPFKSLRKTADKKMVVEEVQTSSRIGTKRAAIEASTNNPPTIEALATATVHVPEASTTADAMTNVCILWFKFVLFLKFRDKNQIFMCIVCGFDEKCLNLGLCLCMVEIVCEIDLELLCLNVEQQWICHLAGLPEALRNGRFAI